jgi:hypothetical protein
MPKFYQIVVLLVLATLVASCGAPATVTQTESILPEPQIDRHPQPTDFSNFYKELTSIPKFDPASTDPWQVDLRSQDLTKLDMTGSLTDLMYADFDSKTQWPVPAMMPTGFDPQKIMEIGKDPGLGIRTLHDQGITGNGIGIAIIDQPMIVDHQEYKDRLQLYEEINISPNTTSQMHGPAVASIAVGKTVGVAPEADLYYIGAWTGDWETGTNNFTYNFKYYAQAVHRILEINTSLPKDRKIHVIAMQTGWSPTQAGYDEIAAAVKEAKANGIFVVSSSLGRTYDLYFQGLGRDPLDNPNQFESYIPGMWWEKDFYEGRPSEQYTGLPANFYSAESMKHMLLIPMDSRTTASPTGTEDYVFYRQGGWSWSIPYIAGMYALAVQVKPDITPEEFWDTALKTGKTIQLQHDGKDYKFGVILDPQALIAALTSE